MYHVQYHRETLRAYNVTFLLKDEYNKACSVYFKHSSNNVNLLDPQLVRVYQSCLKQILKLFQYSESVCIDIYISISDNTAASSTVTKPLIHHIRCENI